MSTAIEIKELSKDYETGFWRKKKVRALDGLTLSVESGQVFGFLGANGAGKTTTIKVLMSLLYPSAGTARILGRDIADVEMHSKIGYCPENPYFYDYLTPIELLNYFGELFGFDAARRKMAAGELLDSVGLDERDWNKQLRKFSKGMLQRVGLAQALINDPEVVFLDEPMSGLDPIGRRDVRELIAGLRGAGKTVFMSTHILSDIEALCDEVAILRNGRLAATGKLDDLLTKRAKQRGFEVNVSGLAADDIRKAVSHFKEAVLLEKPAGASIVIPDEMVIDELLKIVREAGGKLVSIQQIQQSLEELFVEETV
jgi:ABC-2 type transport system ATP-binding protein